jgi:hypothetical protein
MMNSKKILLIVSVICSILLLVGYLSQENLREDVFTVLSLILLVSGYLSGFFVIFFGIVFSILYFIISLPLISFIYGWILFTVSRIHYALFNLIFGKILGRMRWYRDLKSRIKNSSRYKAMVSSLDRVLNGMGLKSPLAMKIFQIDRCNNCGRIIPYDSRFCLYCGSKLT